MNDLDLVADHDTDTTQPLRRSLAGRVLVALAAIPVVLAGAAVINLTTLEAPVEGSPAAPAAAAPAMVQDGQLVAGNLLPRADPIWVAELAIATGIPERALHAYTAAELAITAEQPACGLGWNTLAAIGLIESGHGTHDGAAVAPSGWVSPRILGPALNGDGVAAIADTDRGAWDGDTRWDRAVGPMQFIPDTWHRWGADGNGDGLADPNHIDDAALAAARYLCASGAMTTAEGWRTAIFSYNHLDSYVDRVAAAANQYAQVAP